MARLWLAVVRNSKNVTQDENRDYHCSCVWTRGGHCSHITAFLNVLRNNSPDYMVVFRTDAPAQQRLAAIRAYYKTKNPQAYANTETSHNIPSEAFGTDLAKLANSLPAGPLIGKVPTSTNSPLGKAGIQTVDSNKCYRNTCNAKRINGSQFCVNHTPMDEKPAPIKSVPVYVPENVDSSALRFRMIELD